MSEVETANEDVLQRVLVVDDDPTIFPYLTALLERENLVVRCEADQEGLPGVLREFKPDVVLMDLMQPERSGYELSQTLRLSAEGRRAKYIFMSVLKEREYIKKAFEMGADDYLVKPVQPEDLYICLKRFGLQN